ncbi:SDR family NAD(P)-dependent oxidoreductase [Pseudonocardia pini]|uniref:SDR family NAD(P)-dependent oxidoreductase n=1 Tax=Pseudonocardia pini TaxID=2758030 RepID=UPI0015F0F687|nr:SDR family NAD(P)-dependent oxidoreductase [Pseudonocardia pini]
MKSLSGRVAVVTGAASGVGRGLVDRFAAEGMKVVLADVEEGPLAAAVDEVRAGGAEAIGVRTDVRHEAEVQHLAERTLEAFGAVHVLCNNAGVETGARFADIPTASWQWVLDVNVWGVIHGCRTFLPLMRQQGEGHIVNTGSGASFSASLPTFAPYITSKFAVLGLSESLDMELRAGGEDIHVSLLAPIARTRMTESERNRPRGVAATDADPDRVKVLDAIRAGNEVMAIEIPEIAGMVVDAILAERFYVVVGAEHTVTALEERIAWIRGGPAAEQLAL